MTVWRFAFAVAALFNFAVALPLLRAPGTFFAVLGQALPPDFAFVRLTALLVACFGLGYALVAASPLRFVADTGARRVWPYNWPLVPVRPERIIACIKALGVDVSNWGA